MTTNVSTTTESAVSMTRTISAWRPGSPRQDFQSTATTWGELKAELESKGFSLRDVNVTEGNTQLSLVNNDAVLPTNIQKRGQVTNDLIIIMTPQTNIKSGIIDVEEANYFEVRAEVKKIYNDPETKEEAKAHFGNYTQVKLVDLKELLLEWYAEQEEFATKMSTPSVQQQEQEENVIKVTKEALVQMQTALSKMLEGIQSLQKIITSFTPISLPSDDELAEIVARLNY